jgi:hypothetical protein
MLITNISTPQKSLQTTEESYEATGEQQMQCPISGMDLLHLPSLFGNQLLQSHHLPLTPSQSI